MNLTKRTRRAVLRSLLVLGLLGCFALQGWAEEGLRCENCDGCNGAFYCGLCIVEAVQRRL